jgi:hypothetical protein
MVRMVRIMRFQTLFSHLTKSSALTVGNKRPNISMIPFKCENAKCGDRLYVIDEEETALEQIFKYKNNKGC